MNLTKLTSTLQGLAHEGYAVHDIEIHAHCKDCDSVTVVKDPEVLIERDNETKTIRLKFYPKEENHV